MWMSSQFNYSSIQRNCALKLVKSRTDLRKGQGNFNPHLFTHELLTQTAQLLNVLRTPHTARGPQSEEVEN